MADLPERILTDEVRADLRHSMEHLGGEVRVAVFTGGGRNEKYDQIATQLIGEFSEVDQRIKPTFHKIGDEQSAKHKIDRSPTIMVQPDRLDVRFMGVPLGEEGRTFVMSLIMATSMKRTLSAESRQRLAGLTEKRRVRVYVSPT